MDDNHDGVSQPEELFTLQEVGISEVSLHYFKSRKVDGNGNVFRYRSTVKDTLGSETAKVVYDVFVQIAASKVTARKSDVLP